MKLFSASFQFELFAVLLVTAVSSHSATILQPGPSEGKDIWTTSVFSYDDVAPGPGGGLDNELLRVGGWGDVYYSLLEFDLSGAPSTAALATLELYNGPHIGRGPVGMHVDRITEPWDWKTSGTGRDRERLWWADRPAASQFTTELLSPPKENAWYSIDITDLYNEWQSEGGNYGLQLRPAGPGTTSTQVNNLWNQFLSSDYLDDPSLRPKLVVNTPPPSFDPARVADILAEPGSRPEKGKPILPDTLDFDPNAPTIVVTHGWQPTGDYDDSDFPLSHIVGAIKDELPASFPAGNIIAFSWRDAFTRNPAASRAKSSDAGADLRDALLALFPEDYIQPIHFIGHSHGSIVNANAIHLMKDDYNVAQATILDAPRLENPIVASILPSASVSAPQLKALMPAGSVDYVENFYGGLAPPLIELRDLSISDLEFFVGFGAPLTDAGPDDTSFAPTYIQQLVPFQTHAGIHDDFYTALIGSGKWVSPSLGPDKFESRRTGPDRIWTPVSVIDVLVEIPATIAAGVKAGWEIARGTALSLVEIAVTTAAATGTVIADATGAVVGFVGDAAGAITSSVVDVVKGTADVIVDTGSGLLTLPAKITGSLMGLFESSPAVVAREASVPSDAEVLRFPFYFVKPGDDDWLTLHFEDELLYSFSGGHELEDFVMATIPVTELVGQSGVFYLTLHSSGEVNAEVVVGDFQFVRDTASLDVRVPEPATMVLLGVGVLGLGFARRQLYWGRPT